MEESRRRFLAALTAGVTGALAGCGGDSATPTGDGTDTPTAAETPGTDTPTAAETPAETPTATDASTETGGAPAETVAVGPDGDYRFDPESFTVSVGDTVTWEWASGGHNVKPDAVPDGSDWSGTSGTGTYASGYSYSYTFETAGEYEYHCSPHQRLGMVGSFTVSDE
ncbi:plastocyanin/azurin family copper-binding protein [Haloarcula onubensis]|uniref:Plastocyanin/azurin family copper-binding protein n=1 Tax=Haloarcula onubensis TaxID=2950539 RepID=A0ABU2FPW3_9EURY|nr:plastocyanin/azurin family copper-binding protein [Halomicroarcula sp. S3CR25-11]MDS0282231.1 plastocyanin/azurin family copper-binding protein [Halomicroarcula sp. S3CR25-11]